MGVPALLLALLLTVAGPQVIVPKPVAYETDRGLLVYSENTQIKTKVGDRKFVRETANLPEWSKEAAYRLTISEKGIEIVSATETGAFYARQDLLQMKALSDTLQCCTITDWPRFGYRGMMLDLSGCLFSKESIFKQMDAMAMLKMNVLHLHLTDNAGWRIEIDSCPELYKDKGGYLTKDDCREILARAAELHIEVIPEIELPGHSREVTEAYPELACLDASGKRVINGDVCPGNPEVYRFYETVLDEVMEIFPSRLIHIGGDEASRSGWRSCPHCQALMKKEGLTDVTQLQSYMTRRIAEYLHSKGRTLLGWDEILEGGLSKDAVVMGWRGVNGGNAAVAAGHDVIVCPDTHTYFCYPQDAPFAEPKAFGSYIPIEVTYSYDPAAGLPGDPSHLLGVQCCLWHVHIPTSDHAEYMLYPRTFALAEIGWTPQERRNFPEFRERATVMADVFRSMGYKAFDLREEYGDRYEATHPVKHLAVGKKVTYAEGCHWDTVWYPSTGETALTDGIFGSWAFKDGKWQRLYCDLDVIIDLEEVMPIHYIGATFFSHTIHSQYFPVKVEMFVSDDGVNFVKCGESSYRMTDGAQVSGDFMDFGSAVNATGRYVRYVARRSTAPGHSCIMLDEIVVN